MKPRRSDYLIILASLVAIFLSGAAIGYVAGRKQSPAPGIRDGGAGTSADWEARTLNRLQNELSLNDRQSRQISAEIQKTFLAIRGSKDTLMENYYQQLLDLHDRILPHLDQTQKARLLRDRNQLERVMKERFGNP